MTRQSWRELLPREHGSWAYLAAPQLAAILASHRIVPPLLWLAASLLLFLSFQGFGAVFRRRQHLSIPGALVGAIGLLLLVAIGRDRHWTLLVAVPSLALLVLGLFTLEGRFARKTRFELLGIGAASVQGTGGLLLGGGSLAAAAVLAVASTSYFFLSLIWVRLRLGDEIPGRKPLVSRRRAVPASLGLLLVSLAPGFLTGAPLAGLSPAIYVLRALLPIPRREDGRIRVPLLGAQEAFIAALFALGVGLSLPV